MEISNTEFEKIWNGSNTLTIDQCNIGERIRIRSNNGRIIHATIAHHQDDWAVLRLINKQVARSLIKTGI